MHMRRDKPGPFRETAAELLARARATPSPVKEYGYFVAKTGELVGDRELAERCEELWRRCVARGYESGTEVHPVDGVSAWRNRTSELVVSVVAQNASTGRVSVTRLTTFASTDRPSVHPR